MLLLKFVFSSFSDSLLLEQGSVGQAMMKNQETTILLSLTFMQETILCIYCYSYKVCINKEKGKILGEEFNTLKIRAKNKLTRSQSV